MAARASSSLGGEARLISPLEGEMSPKATEGVGPTGRDLIVAGEGRRSTRGDPLKGQGNRIWQCQPPLRPLRGHLSPISWGRGNANRRGRCPSKAWVPRPHVSGGEVARRSRDGEGERHMRLPCLKGGDEAPALRYGSGRSSLQSTNRCRLIGLRPTAPHSTRSIVSVVFSTQMKQQVSQGWSLSGPTPAEIASLPFTQAP